MRPNPEPKTRLVVQHVDPYDGSAKSALDPSNDPEMRCGLPMTFGTCRPDLRRYVREGDTIIFVAIVKNDASGVQYYLTSYFLVDEALPNHAEALARFGPRPNIAIIPADGSTTDTLWLEGHEYQQAPTDVHDGDWQERARSPYLISDTVVSRIVRPGIAWNEVVAEGPQGEEDTLLRAEELCTFHRHLPRLVRSAVARKYLANTVRRLTRNDYETRPAPRKMPRSALGACDPVYAPLQ
jgi:hypothetical protein